MNVSRINFSFHLQNLRNKSLSSLNGFSFISSLLFCHFFVNVHYFLGNSCAAESTVVEKVLHGNFPSEVAEHHYAIVGTFICSSISEWRHIIGIAKKPTESFYAASCRSIGRRL